MSDPLREKLKKVGVCAIPNICGTCHRFKAWDELITHFVPDTSFSSESESWRECARCHDARIAREEDRRIQSAILSSAL